MTAHHRTRLGLPFVTNPSDQTKRTILLGGSDAYQSLPDFSQGWHKPLVILDWSTKVYHSPNLGQTRGRVAFTNDYRRELGTRLICSYNELCTMIDCS